jgi:hypothetical protein
MIKPVVYAIRLPRCSKYLSVSIDLLTALSSPYAICIKSSWWPLARRAYIAASQITLACQSLIGTTRSNAGPPIHRSSSSDQVLTQILGHHGGGHVRRCTDDDSIPGDNKLVTTSTRGPWPWNVAHGDDTYHRGTAVQELWQTGQPNIYRVRVARIMTNYYPLYCMSLTICFLSPLGRVDQCMDRIAELISHDTPSRLGATSFTLSASVRTGIYARYIQSIHYDLLVI